MSLALKEYEGKLETYKLNLTELGKQAMKGYLPSEKYYKYMNSLLDDIHTLYDKYLMETGSPYERRTEIYTIEYRY